MRSLVALALALGVSGCCCGFKSSSDDAWSREVSRRAVGPATGGLAVGTANQFRLELLAPAGQSVSALGAREQAAAEREVRELELAVTQKKLDLGVVEEATFRHSRRRLTEEGYQAWLARGDVVLDAGVQVITSETRSGTERSYEVTVREKTNAREVSGHSRQEALAQWGTLLAQQQAEVAALAPEAPLDLEAPLVVHERVRFVTLFPPVPQAEEDGFASLIRGQFCTSCEQEAARGKGQLLRSFGHAGVDMARVSPEQLRAGLELPDADVSVYGFDLSAGIRLRRPAGAKLLLTLDSSCPATVRRVDDTLTVGFGSGMIAIPERQDVFWWEVRDAPCLGAGSRTTHEVTPAGQGGRAAPPNVDFSLSARLRAAREELQRLETLASP